MSEKRQARRTKGRFAAAGAIVAVAVAMFALAGLTNAITPNALAAHDPSVTCKGNHALSFSYGVPAGAHRVLHLTWNVVNDEDSGFAGYWAMDSYKTVVTVWKLPDGSYFVSKTYKGYFQVPQGALSPNGGVSEPAAGFGTMKGGYFATIANTETFSPGSNPTNANLGTMSYGGTTSDILLGTYGNGQVGPTSPYDWYGTYFAPATGGDFTYGNSGNGWGWDYSLNSYFENSTTSGEWCNFGTSSWGDVVTAGES